MNNSYLFYNGNDWFALLPNHTYKKIPYINWVEDVDWSYVYYAIYRAILLNQITDLDIIEWDLTRILEVIDIRL